VELPVLSIKSDSLDQEECNGEVYRCRVSDYLSNNGDVVSKLSFSKLKRMSCSGCDSCGGGFSDDLSDFIGEEGLIFPSNPVDGGLYRLMIANVTRDWEYGVVDGWDLEFVRIET